MYQCDLYSDIRPIALSSSLTSDIYKYVMGDDQCSHSAAESQCSVHYNYHYNYRYTASHERAFVFLFFYRFVKQSSLNFSVD